MNSHTFVMFFYINSANKAGVFALVVVSRFSGYLNPVAAILSLLYFCFHREKCSESIKVSIFKYVKCLKHFCE